MPGPRADFLNTVLHAAVLVGAAQAIGRFLARSSLLAPVLASTVASRSNVAGVQVDDASGTPRRGSVTLGKKRFFHVGVVLIDFEGSDSRSSRDLLDLGNLRHCSYGLAATPAFVSPFSR